MTNEEKRKLREEEEPSENAEPKVALSEPVSEDSSPTGQEEQFYLKTIESLRSERDEYYDLLLRRQAELENFRRRSEREKGESRLGGQMAVLRELLLVVDACEKGLSSMPVDDSEAETFQVFRAGYDLLLKQLKSILDRFEVSEIPSVGTRFDPMLHEAVYREVTPDHADGTILEEYRKGYLMREKLLRPAQVKVAVHPH